MTTLHAAMNEAHVVHHALSYYPLFAHRIAAQFGHCSPVPHDQNPVAQIGEIGIFRAAQRESPYREEAASLICLKYRAP